MNHLQAIRGLHTTRHIEAEISGRQAAQADAGELHRWQVTQRENVRAARLLQAQAATQPLGLPELPPLKLTLGGEAYAWIQCTQPQHYTEDFVAGGHHLHLTPFRQEVLLMPLSVASWLLTNRPTEWRQATVYPASVVFGTDGASGLDTVTGMSTLTWGYNAASNSAYFTLDGDVGQNDSAWMQLDANNQPSLIQ